MPAIPHEKVAVRLCNLFHAIIFCECSYISLHNELHILADICMSLHIHSYVQVCFNVGIVLSNAIA